MEFKYNNEVEVYAKEDPQFQNSYEECFFPNQTMEIVLKGLSVNIDKVRNRVLDIIEDLRVML